MTTDPFSSIEAVVAEADALLRRQLSERTPKVPHVVVALGPNGAAVIRSNVGPDMLETIARGLLEVVAQSRGKTHTRH